MNARGVLPSCSQPRYAAQLVVAGAVKVRSPATTPISTARTRTIICFLQPRAGRRRLLALAEPTLILFEELSDDRDRGCRLLFHQPMTGIGNDRAGHVGCDEADVVGHGGAEGFFRANGQNRNPQLAVSRDEVPIVDRVLR